MGGPRTTGLFVTGTDTDVGKTVVAAALTAVLRARNVDAVPMKPVQTGCRRAGRRLVAPDLEFCLAVCGLRATVAEKERMAPYRFAPACSPHLAARRAGRRIGFARVRKRYGELAADHAFVVVEGAGGVMVPVAGKRLMTDMMHTLGVPVVLVARSGLGTINHTLLSVEALRRSGLDVLGIVFNDVPARGPAHIARDNKRTIARLSGLPVLGHLPRLRCLARGTPRPDRFLEACMPHVPGLRKLCRGMAGGRGHASPLSL